MLVIVIYKLLLNHFNGLTGEMFQLELSKEFRIEVFYSDISDFQHPLYIR